MKYEVRHNINVIAPRTYYCVQKMYLHTYVYASKYIYVDTLWAQAISR